MGQKVNPMSLRLEHTNRRFESCWYGDYQYSYLLSKDLKVKSYINSILKHLGCPESHISLIYMAKKIKILFCYLDPRRSTYKKSRRLYIKMVNKDPIEMLYQKQRPYFISRFLGRYLRRRLEKKGSNAPKQAGIKHNQKLSFLMKKKESPRDVLGKNQYISRHEKNRRKQDQFLSTPMSASLKVINRNPKKKIGEHSKTFLSDTTPAQRAQRVGSVIKQKGKARLENASLQTIKSKKKEIESNNVNTTRQRFPYSPLVDRRNPFKLLNPKKEKKKKKEKYFTKRPLYDPSAKAYKNWWKAWRRRRKLKGKKITNTDLRRRQARRWKNLTKFSVSRIGRGKSKKYNATSFIWRYLFYNYKAFFNKAIQRRKGFQTWKKSLFIRYLLLFVYKQRLKFTTFPIKHQAERQSCRSGMPADNPIKFVSFLEKKDSKSHVKANLETKNKKTKNLYIENSLISLNTQGIKKKDFNATADLANAKQGRQLSKERKNHGLLKYHKALESINKMEWFRGRSMSFLWLLFNSVHPSQKVIKKKSSVFNGGGKSSLLQNRYSFNSLPADSKEKKSTPILYTFPYQIQPSKITIANKIKNNSSAETMQQSEINKKSLPISMLIEKVNFFNPSALQFSKEKVMVKKNENSLLCLPRKETTFSLKQGKKKTTKKRFSDRFSVYKKEERSTGLKKSKIGKYRKKKVRNVSLKMPRKSLYPRTVKSKDFLSYIEYILSTDLGSNVRVLSWKTKNEKKSALFIVEQIIYFLQKRVPFGKIKQQLWRELKIKYMRGFRITYSGRLGGRSKKAQRSRQKTFQWGKTSSHVFSSKLSFASKSALTKFGKVGIKVWVCYN